MEAYNTAKNFLPSMNLYDIKGFSRYETQANVNKLNIVCHLVNSSGGELGPMRHWNFGITFSIYLSDLWNENKCHFMSAIKTVSSAVNKSLHGGAWISNIILIVVSFSAINY